ncbi:hypothetical protein DIPPA_25209 [Diplonema papillatum]|nr:hypothetical protein DIPPA_25209 [Diplonema papillatum]
MSPNARLVVAGVCATLAVLAGWSSAGSPLPVPAAAQAGPAIKTEIVASGRCTAEIRNFCVSSRGVHVFVADPSNPRADGLPALPYCQEMAPNDPPVLTRYVASSESKGLRFADDEVAFVYPTTPFYLTPWHLWINTLAAYDTVERYNLSDSPVFVQWYRGKYRHRPSYKPTLQPPPAGFKMAPLLNCLGKGAVGFDELPAAAPGCFARGVVGVARWAEGLPLATANNSYGHHYDKGLVRRWMARLGACVGWDAQAARARACGAPSFAASVLRRQKGRQILNADAVAASLGAVPGFRVAEAFAEGLTLQQQLEVFSEADVVVSAFGSGLTWLPFMRRAGVVLAIIPGQGAGGDKYLPGLRGPALPVNTYTSIGTWAQHLDYYTLTSGPTAKTKNWKDQDVVAPPELLAEFVAIVTEHFSGQFVKSCDAW